MKTAVLYEAWLRRTFIEFRRYLFDTISGLVTIYGFFLIIFLGAQMFGGSAPGFGHTLSGVVVSYALWALTIFSLSTLTFDLTQEAQLGTLEQLGMSPFGLPHVLVARIFTGLVIQIGMMSVLLVMMMATTGRWLNIDVISILPLLLVALLGVIGFGFVLAGLAIVFKRIQQSLQIFQVLVIFFVAVPADEVPLAKLLPLAWGATLLRRVMVDDVSIFAMRVPDLVLLTVVSVAYFALGIAVFKLFESAARQRGLLGHY